MSIHRFTNKGYITNTRMYNIYIYNIKLYNTSLIVNIKLYTYMHIYICIYRETKPFKSVLTQNKTTITPLARAWLKHTRTTKRLWILAQKRFTATAPAPKRRKSTYSCIENAMITSQQPFWLIDCHLLKLPKGQIAKAPDSNGFECTEIGILWIAWTPRISAKKQFWKNSEKRDVLLMDKILHHLGWLKPYK